MKNKHLDNVIPLHLQDLFFGKCPSYKLLNFKFNEESGKYFKMEPVIENVERYKVDNPQALMHFYTIPLNNHHVTVSKDQDGAVNELAEKTICFNTVERCYDIVKSYQDDNMHMYGDLYVSGPHKYECMGS